MKAGPFQTPLSGHSEGPPQITMGFEQGVGNENRRSLNKAGGFHFVLLCRDQLFLSSVSTCFATAFNVSKTPVPSVATASKTGSPFRFSS